MQLIILHIGPIMPHRNGLCLPYNGKHIRVGIFFLPVPKQYATYFESSGLLPPSVFISEDLHIIRVSIQVAKKPQEE